MACMAYIINLRTSPTAVSKLYSLLRYIMTELSATYFLTREWGTSIVHVILLHTSGLPVFKKVCSTKYGSSLLVSTK